MFNYSPFLITSCKMDNNPVDTATVENQKIIDDTDDYSLGINPQIPNTLFAGSLSGLVYRTTDGGENWLDKTKGLPGLFSASIIDFNFTTF
jgi:hypothetical protein